MNSLSHKNNQALKPAMLHAKTNHFVQPKLTINTPGDVYEQEADAMAYKVMRMSSSETAKPLTGLIGKSLQRKCTHCEEEEKKKPLMRKAEADNAGMSVSSSFASSLNASKGTGSPLPQATRSFMENSFSADFSGVKIHTGSQASEMSKGINAKAFTLGNDIYFNTGRFDSDSSAGKGLLAHELTHVVQQRGIIQRDPDPEAEVETEVATERIIYRNNTPLYSSPVDDILNYPPIALLKRGTKVKVISESPTSGNELVEVVGTDQSGYISSFVDSPLMDSEPYQKLEQYLDFNTGWHVKLPQSTLKGGSIAFVKGSGKTAPRLGGKYPANPVREAVTNPEEDANRSAVISYIRDNLSKVQIPTDSGKLDIYQGGYVYTAPKKSNPVSQQQADFTKTMDLKRLGYNSPDKRLQGLWEQFKRVSNHEGDTSAINAWDDQIITVGAGISAKAGGNAGDVYNRMPLQARQNLYEYGIRVNDDNTFTVLDLERGVVENGNNALRLIQVNPQMIGALIQLGQSQETMTTGSTTLTSQEWMARAQFEWFRKRNNGVPDSVFSWSVEVRQFAFLLGHWSGALTWGGMGATGGDANALAKYALKTILKAMPDWSSTYVEGRLRGLASDSGVTTTISF